jgi:hypothetical protein
VNKGITVENILSKELACVINNRKSNFTGRNRCEFQAVYSLLICNTDGQIVFTELRLLYTNV